MRRTKTGKSDVPKILRGRNTRLNTLFCSTSVTALNIPDTCACWTPAALKQAKTLLIGGLRVGCADATTYAAMLALSIELMNTGEGLVDMAQIERLYPVLEMVSA